MCVCVCVYVCLVALCALYVRGQAQGNPGVLCSPGSTQNRKGLQSREGFPHFDRPMGSLQGANYSGLVLLCYWLGAEVGTDACTVSMCAFPSWPPSEGGERLVPGTQEDQGRHGPASPEPRVACPSATSPRFSRTLSVYCCSFLIICSGLAGRCFIVWSPDWWRWFFHKESHPFQVEFPFCPPFVFANISGLIEHSSLFQPKHMLAFPAQYGNLGV